MTTEHKHASVLRAIADGVPLSEFELTSNYYWENMGDGSMWSDWFYRPNEWQVRRKPQYITVNGFKVPKPLDCVADGATYFTPNTDSSMLYGGKTAMTPSTTELHVKRGIAHATKEAAIAHAKAMLGIDPEAA